MGIVRYEPIAINNVTNGVDEFGEYTTTITKWFDTRAVVSDVANSLKIADRYREYAELVNLRLNYTPYMRDVANSQELYSVTWRDQDWRITDVRESNDRMHITLLCYRAEPGVPV